MPRNEDVRGRAIAAFQAPGRVVASATVASAAWADGRLVRGVRRRHDVSKRDG